MQSDDFIIEISRLNFENFIWITFADDPFVISIFIILYNSLSN